MRKRDELGTSTFEAQYPIRTVRMYSISGVGPAAYFAGLPPSPVFV